MIPNELFSCTSLYLVNLTEIFQMLGTSLFENKAYKRVTKPTRVLYRTRMTGPRSNHAKHVQHSEFRTPGKGPLLHSVSDEIRQPEQRDMCPKLG